jgi:DNA-binding NarL/FixJ family response regulator
VAAGLDIATERIEAGPLANREVEVARLVAEGLSNKQIGVRLSISESTVASHIRSILTKRGLNSRALAESGVKLASESSK